MIISIVIKGQKMNLTIMTNKKAIDSAVQSIQKLAASMGVKLSLIENKFGIISTYLFLFPVLRS